MKRMTFSEFYKGLYDDDDFELYLVRNSQAEVMYIGISRTSIWHRWFGGIGHMYFATDGNMRGKSYIGAVIERRFPESWNWIIELWTGQDCLEACKESFAGKVLDKVSIEQIEPYMIVKFEPLYNVIHGGGRHEDPLTTKKLDAIHKDLFG